MTDHDDLFTEAALPVLREWHGRSITWHDPLCDDQTVIARIGNVRVEPQDADEGIKRRGFATITVQLSELSNTPAENHEVTFDGQRWRVIGIMNRTPVEMTVEVERIAAAEVAPDYRNR